MFNLWQDNTNDEWFEGVRVYSSVERAQLNILPVSLSRKGTQFIKGQYCASRKYCLQHAKTYEKDSFIPKGEFRNLTKSEAETIFVNDAPFRKSDFIGHFATPKLILDAFYRAYDDDGKTLRINDSLFAGAVTRFHDYIETRYALDDTFRSLATVEKSGNLPTLTTNKNGQYTGLHFDSWDNRLPAERSLSSNRISLNIGTEPRFLLFLNLNLLQMKTALEKHFSIIVENINEVPRTFMQNFPTYPVCRLRIKPGEAYIAPTENIVHDGSSQGTTSRDISYTAKGRFLVV